MSDCEYSPEYQIPDNLSDADIRGMVEALFTDEGESPKTYDVMYKTDYYEVCDQLKVIGERAAPFLVEALGDPRTPTHARRFEDLLDPKSPFARICNLLRRLYPREAVAPLANYLDPPVRGFRKEAALVLGGIASADCVESIRKALKDDEGDVRTYAAMGINHAIRGKRGDTEFFNQIFSDLAELLEWKDIHGFVPNLLASIDMNRAVPLFLSPQCFSLQNPQLQYVLRALNYTARHPIPHELLLPLLEQLEPLSNQYRQREEYGLALVAYAINSDARTRRKLKSQLSSPTREVAAWAAEALRMLRGPKDVWETIQEIEEAHGFGALSQAQQHYYAVLLYDSEVNNGGHVQYFVNSFSNHCSAALEGLRAMNAPQRAEILEQAVTIFGCEGPSPVRARRREIVYDQLTDQQFDFLDRLNDRYYACEENIQKLLALYAVHHKRQFRGLSTKKK